MFLGREGPLARGSLGARVPWREGPLEWQLVKREQKITPARLRVDKKSADGLNATRASRPRQIPCSP